MNNEKIKIELPFKRNYYITFINSLISIHFYKDNSITIESLKNLLFPPSVSDEEFNNLKDLITFSFDEILKSNREKAYLESELKQKYQFNTEEIIDPIIAAVSAKSQEILKLLNSGFNESEYELRNFNWEVKSILSSKNDSYVESRFSDLDFSLTDSNSEKKELRNILISFTKNDSDKMFGELKKIKENLNAINNTMNNLGAEI